MLEAGKDVLVEKPLSMDLETGRLLVRRAEELGRVLMTGHTFLFNPSVLKTKEIPFKLHIDGAYGGFYFPFSCEDHRLDYRNEDVSSITLDAHKMVQAPYGTGIFTCRKDLMKYASTDATYVAGGDYTLTGSRSGANAVAVWMILMRHGPYGWKEKIFVLQNRTNWLCEMLDEKHISYFRHPKSNIVTLKAEQVGAQLAAEYGLVPDNHSNPNWFKIVVMEHVTMENLIPFVEKL